jgi:hypothetical protein
MTMGAWRVKRSVERRIIDGWFIDFRQRHIGIWIPLSQGRRLAGQHESASQRSGANENDAGDDDSSETSNCAAANEPGGMPHCNLLGRQVNAPGST